MASSNSAKQFDTFLDEKYIPLDKKIKIAIVVAALVIPVALFYFLFYKPGIDKIRQRQKKLPASCQNIRLKLKKRKKNLKKSLLSFLKPKKFQISCATFLIWARVQAWIFFPSNQEQRSLKIFMLKFR